MSPSPTVFRWCKDWLRERFFRRYYRTDFLKRLPPGARVLDVGCGNDSPRRFKALRPDLYYVGLDVGDYAHSTAPQANADEYVVVASQDFARQIEQWEGRFDGVVSSHNIEHCEEPARVVAAMAKALRPGGRLYLACPTEASVGFPSRGGTLNFHDDPTHVWLPKFADQLRWLRDSGLVIEFQSPRYRPWKPALRGLLREPESRRTKTVLEHTWALWGFEAVIWAARPQSA